MTQIYYGQIDIDTEHKGKTVYSLSFGAGILEAFEEQQREVKVQEK